MFTYIYEFVYVCVIEAGPELIMTGRCPFHVCKNRREQELAKWMILKIQEKYPELFYNAVNDLSRRGWCNYRELSLRFFLLQEYTYVASKDITETDPKWPKSPQG